MVTVAICTYNRKKYLEICLEKLIDSAKFFNIPILVIDNSSDDDTHNVVNEFSRKCPLVTYVLCAERGLSHARNKALDFCTTEWLAFIDDDAYPADNWLENALRIIQEGQFDAFGGVYYPWYAEGKVPWFKDCYETNDTWMPPGEEYLLTQGYFSGGNSVFNIKKLRTSGGFPVELGMNGSSVGYGEDNAAQRAMAINGNRLGFSRRLIIHHLVPMRKQQWQWAWKRRFASGRDFWATYSKQLTGWNLLFYVRDSIVNALKITAKSLRLFLSGRCRLNNVLYETGHFAKALGLFIGYYRCRK